MKTKITIVLALLLSLVLHTTKSNSHWHRLSKDLYSIDDTARYINWYCVGFPDSKTIKWELYSDTVNRVKIKEGNIDIPALCLPSDTTFNYGSVHLYIEQYYNW